MVLCEKSRQIEGIINKTLKKNKIKMYVPIRAWVLLIFCHILALVL